MREELVERIEAVCKTLFGAEIKLELTRPEEQFGDFSTNVAMKLPKQLGKNPRELAEQIVAKINEQDEGLRASVAGPGFINIKISDQQLWETIQTATSLSRSLEGQTIVFEYSDPNPFKVLHAGHLYQTIIGDAIANILDEAGAKVHRVNFSGDVGLHVGKTMWAILHTLAGPDLGEMRAFDQLQETVAKWSLQKKADWLSQQYIKGSQAYETDEGAKKEIIIRSKMVYRITNNQIKENNLAKIYWQTRQWSYDYFIYFYNKIGVKPFENYPKNYPESQMAPIGLKIVREQQAKGIYEESDGTVIFKGEPYGLHTRVFINSEGLPTYEAKDVGLIMKKQQDYPDFDRTIIITGNDVVEYMKVVLKSIEQFEPELVRRTTHLTHGQIKLAGGEKMSSRKGNILRAQDILDAAREAGKELDMDVTDDIVLGAVKYAFTKQTMGPDIIYDPKESISIHGHSGPYLQYALVRAKSILKKVQPTTNHQLPTTNLDPFERSLARKISMYSETFGLALNEYAPHHVANYLYELSQVFSRFYENSQVAGDPREALRASLVSNYATVLTHGLNMLGMSMPEKM